MNFSDALLRLFTNYTKNENGCWIWKGSKRKDGYGVIRFDGRKMSTHRLMFLLYFGPIPDGKFVCHKCDNPPCINPDHLFVATHIENTMDKMKKGRYGFDRVGWPSKLTLNQRIEIVADNRVQKEIAREYGITSAWVSILKTRSRNISLYPTPDLLTKKIGPGPCRNCS